MLSDFRSYNYLPSCKKDKKLIRSYREKLLTDRKDRQTDGWTDNGNFIGPSVYGGPIFPVVKTTKEC